MLPIIVDFGTLHFLGLSVSPRLFGYGLMLVLGFLLGIGLAQWRARRAGEDPDAIVRCGMLALLGGVVGARLAFIIEQWNDYRNVSIGAWFDLSSGGLIYYGGVAMGTVLVLVYLYRKRLPVRRYLDILAPSLMIGLAFGRAGCTLNGCCFGAPARDGWAMSMRFPMYPQPLLKFDGRENPYSTGTDGPTPLYAEQLNAGRAVPDPRLEEAMGRLRPWEFDADLVALAQASHTSPVKPAQVLGLVGALLLAAILLAFSRLRRREGQVFALMMILYPITRFMLESIRDDNPHNLARGVLTHNQWTSLAVVAAGAIIMAGLSRFAPSAGPGLAEREAAAARAARRTEPKTTTRKRKRRK